MKANEAPKKIYLYPDDRAGYEYEAEWGDKHWGEESVEYTRTDVIVERAEKYLHEHLVEYWMQKINDGSKFIDDFRKYIKGE